MDDVHWLIFSLRAHSTFERIYICQSITLFVVAFATSEDKVPSFIFQNE